MTELLTRDADALHRALVQSGDEVELSLSRETAEWPARIVDARVRGQEIVLTRGSAEVTPAEAVPPPFDALITRYLAARPNLTTATNRKSRWLFPGRRAGQPLHPTTIRLRFQTLGIPNLNGRSRALREMLLHAPPSVVARMLGYAPDRAEAIAAEAGATWKHYAPGDHTRSRRPQQGQ